jgi:hypothetical protein
VFKGVLFMLRITSSNLTALAAVSLFSLVGIGSANAATVTAHISAVKMTPPNPRDRPYSNITAGGDFGWEPQTNAQGRILVEVLTYAGATPIYIDSKMVPASVSAVLNTSTRYVTMPTGIFVNTNRVFTGTMGSGNQTILVQAMDTCPVPM